MHTCPLRSIKVGNFKSIARGKVEFRPLTVLVGMNSSGKSSLLQAVRFLSQTATTHNAGIEVPLNGAKAKLGTFDDVRTAGADGQVSFQAELVTAGYGDSDCGRVDPEVLLRLEVAEPATRLDRGYVQVTVNQIEVSSAAVLFCARNWLNAIWDGVEATWGYVWDPGIAGGSSWNDTTELSEALERASGVKRAFTHADQSFVRAGVDDIRRALAGLKLPTYEEFMRDMWESVLQIGDEHSRNVLIQLLVGRLISSPGFVKEIDESGDAFRLLVEGLNSPSSDDARPESPSEAPREALARLIGSELATQFFEPTHQQPSSSFEEHFIRAFYREQDAQLDVAPASYSIPGSSDLADIKRISDAIRGRTRRYSDSERAALGLSMIEVGGLSFEEDPEMDDGGLGTSPKTDTLKIAQLFIQECIGDEWAKDPLLRQGANRAIAGRWRLAVTELLRDRIRYLGPLRHEPRSFFDLDDETRPDVGAAGEHLSRALQWHGTKSVDVPGLGQTDLVDGLQHWLRELRLVEDVTVEARGRAGVSIEVRPLDLDRRVDLTSVGVGVSQILPVLAVCLLAEPGDIVMLEQPELHLHPTLQMRLGDFLVACTQSGRQIIVETHSEHLVNRLRRRIAEDDTNDTSKLVRVVFAERDAEGHTAFRPSDINPLGGLSQDWPDGFLDLGARDAQKLLQASLAKHRRLDDD